jgi:hypothetical protein
MAFKMKGYSGYTESPMKKKQTPPKKSNKMRPHEFTPLKPLPHIPKVEHKKFEKKVVPEKYKKKKKI